MQPLRSRKNEGPILLTPSLMFATSLAEASFQSLSAALSLLRAFNVIGILNHASIIHDNVRLAAGIVTVLIVVVVVVTN